MSHLWISIGLLLVTGCGGDAGTGTRVGDETGGTDPALPESGTTGPSDESVGTDGPVGETNVEPGSSPESAVSTTPDPDLDSTPTDAVPTDAVPTDPDPEAVPDTSQNEPSANQNEPDPDSGTDPDVDPEAPVSLSFAADIWPVWSAVRAPVFVYRGLGSYTACTDVGVCHGGGTPGAGLSMADQQTAYTQMMDTASVSGLCAGTQRVVVGDPDNSCLILFYEGRLGRQDLDWVDDTEIELMREWIRQGAPP